MGSKILKEIKFHSSVKVWDVAQLPHQIILPQRHWQQLTMLTNYQLVSVTTVSSSLELIINQRPYQFSSIHHALCVLRCLVKNRNLVPGGGAVEAELSLRLGQRAKEIGGVDGYCLQRYAEALEVIPYTLAENAALN